MKDRHGIDDATVMNLQAIHAMLVLSRRVGETLMMPVHQVIPVDLYLPGCPPPAERVRKVLEALVAAKPVEFTGADLAFGLLCED